MDWKGKYFTLNEMIASPTARRLGISNKPTADITAALERLVVNVLDPLREEWGAPIVVTSGYRSPRLNRVVGGARMSQHCFDEQTEVLTESGWKTYATIDEDDMVYSYNIEKGCLEITPIDSIIIREHNGKMMHMKDTCLDVMVTDKHRMLVRYAPHKYKRKGGKNISPEGQAYFDTLKTDNDKWHIELANEVFGKRRRYMCSSVYDGQKLSKEQLALLRFCMAFVSDGFWCKKDKYRAMGFRFKKERKIHHLQELAQDLKWPYTMRVDKCGVTNFYFRAAYAASVYDIVGKEKLLPTYLMTLSLSDKTNLLECYAAYDGNFDSRDDHNRFSISTTIKRNADILQAMAITCGIKCSMVKVEGHDYIIKGKEGTSRDSYTLMTCQKRETEASVRSYEWVDYDGVVWCANNKNTTLVTRRNGKVSIQGNCFGCAADIRTVSDRPEDNKRLRDLLVSLNLPYDQLIDEFGCDWLHVSHRASGNRGQLLSAKRVKGKTIYVSGIK